MQWQVQGPGAVQWEVIGGDPGGELDLSQFGFNMGDMQGMQMGGGGGGGDGGTVRYSTGWSGGEKKAAAAKPPPKVARVMSQNYGEVKRECLKQGALWEDPNFPAVNKSIYYSYNQDFKWMRPGELCDDPHMFVGGVDRFDVKQGDLGNCWFLASIASLCVAKDRDILYRVVPQDNSFTDDYAGVFHFQFWQYGKWVDVVVDDRLPTNNGQLMFVHSHTPNEFWSALLEKAYAKLNGSYEALTGGCSAEAMEDFTGGMCETFDFKKNVPKNLLTIMCRAFDRCSLMGCTIDAEGGQIEGELANGLVMGHAYSITAVRKVNIRNRDIGLVRVRNPWGNQTEWKGAWSDKSPEWNYLDDGQKQELGISIDDDGEFWMSYDDFITNFHKMEICHQHPETIEEFDVEVKHKRSWEVKKEHGSWKRRVNAGGCRNFLDTFWTNPQYRVQIVDPDEGDEDNTGTLFIGLMQKERRKLKQDSNVDLLTLGYMIYQIPDPSVGPLDMNFFKFNKAMGRSAFTNAREVVGRHKLAPGHYVVIPCTFQPNEEGDFLLRLFAERKFESAEMDEATGIAGPDDASQGQDHGATGSETARRRRRAREITQEDVVDEQKIRAQFKATAGEDLMIDAFELRHLLDDLYMKEFKFDGFSPETARALVAFGDLDHTGKLNYQEFQKLSATLRTWKKIFKEFDEDKSGTMNSYEIRQALNAAGYKVSNATFNCFVMKYSDRMGRIFFDDFVLCATRLKTMFHVFKDMSGADQIAKFSMDQFIQTTMYG